MALDFGILQPANISGQLQAGQESAMRNQLAQQQLASGRTEQEMSQMKLSELRRNTAALESMQRKFVENGKSDDMESNYQAMIASGIPQFIDIGFKGRQLLAQTRQDYISMGLPVPAYLQPKGQGAATEAPAPGAPAPAQGIVSKPFTPEQVLEEERRWAQMAMGGSTKGLAPMLDSKGNLLNPMTPERRALDEQRLQQMADGTAGMAMPAVTGRPIQPEQALNVVSRSEGSPSPIPTANMLAPAAAPATNMLAPPPAAPANALAAPGMSAEEQRARTMLLSQNPGVRAAGQTELNRLTALHTLAPGGTLRDAKGNIIAQAPEATSADVRTMKDLGYPLTQEGYAAFRDAQRQDRILTPAEEAQRIRIANASRAPRPEAAPRTQQVTMSDGTLGIMNMDTGAVTPSTLGGVPVKGKPSAFAEKTAIQQKQLGVDINRTIGELEDAAAPGGLIEQSTGSGIGRAVDVGARIFGKAMPGDIAIGKLAPVADMVLKMIPRFEGPQSDKDTKSYKEAAGQLADATLPVKIRQAAAIEIVRLMKARKNQFRTSDMAAEGAGAAQIAPPAGFVPDQR
jgi:hypothetical protein